MSYPIGNLHTHPSHNIVLYEGVLFYVECGCTGVNKAMNLGYSCKNVLETDELYGQNNIKRYKKGKSLAGFPGWPFDKAKVFDQTVLRTVRCAVACLRNTELQRIEPDLESQSDSEVSIISGALSDLGSSGDSSSD